MTTDEWCLFTLLVLVVDAIVIAIAAAHLWGPPPALIGGWV